MKPAKTLAIDIGGTGLKAAVLDPRGKIIGRHVRVDTPYPCPTPVMIKTLTALVRPLRAYDRISLGFPGVVKRGTIVTAPHFGTPQWAGFDFRKAIERALGKPARVINDAEMQGFAAIRGKGLELVITLGTGVGSALFLNGQLTPHLELAHHPVHGGKTYNDYVGNRARKKIGNRKWNKRVRNVIDILTSLLNYDSLIIGGGNAARLTFKLDRNTRLVSNDAGLLGGIALWRDGGLHV